MWVPKSEQEIRDRIEDGSAQETATLEFKRELGRNNKEIAKDVAAMSTDGGVIIYGIDENEHGQPVARPIPLAGQPERLDQIVQSGIHEPPTIQVSTITSQQDEGLGYLVVLVPPSDRAPHMVQIKEDNRYYGRGATGNRILGQGEVARLYERRQEWQLSAEDVLREMIEEIGAAPREGRGYLYIVVKPLLTDDRFLERALGPEEQHQEQLQDILEEIRREGFLPRAPGLAFGGYFQHHQVGWWNDMGIAGQMPETQLDLYVHFTGMLGVFFDAISHETRPQDAGSSFVVLQDKGLSKLMFRTLRFAGRLYERGQYFGPVLCGVGLTGIKGSISAWRIDRGGFWFRGGSQLYDKDEYLRGERCLATELVSDATSVGKRLLHPLFRATTRGEFRPFDQSGG